MSSQARVTGHQRTARLPADLQARLDALVRTRGFWGAERDTGIPYGLLEKLYQGGCARPDAVERAAGRLKP